jgi:hypothetical protein
MIENFKEIMTITLLVRHKGGGVSYFLLEPESEYDFKQYPWIKGIFEQSIELLKELINDRKHE